MTGKVDRAAPFYWKNLGRKLEKRDQLNHKKLAGASQPDRQSAETSLLTILLLDLSLEGH